MIRDEMSDAWVAPNNSELSSPKWLSFIRKPPCKDDHILETFCE